GNAAVLQRRLRPLQESGGLLLLAAERSRIFRGPLPLRLPLPLGRALFLGRPLPLRRPLLLGRPLPLGRPLFRGRSLLLGHPLGDGNPLPGRAHFRRELVEVLHRGDVNGREGLSPLVDLQLPPLLEALALAVVGEVVLPPHLA